MIHLVDNRKYTDVSQSTHDERRAEDEVWREEENIVVRMIGTSELGWVIHDGRMSFAFNNRAIAIDSAKLLSYFPFVSTPTSIFPKHEH